MLAGIGLCKVNYSEVFSSFPLKWRISSLFLKYCLFLPGGAFISAAFLTLEVEVFSFDCFEINETP